MYIWILSSDHRGQHVFYIRSTNCRGKGAVGWEEARPCLKIGATQNQTAKFEGKSFAGWIGLPENFGSQVQKVILFFHTFVCLRVLLCDCSTQAFAEMINIQISISPPFFRICYRRDPATSSSVSLNCFVDGEVQDNETQYMKVYCEHCLGIIWRLIQAWHRYMDVK